MRGAPCYGISPCNRAESPVGTPVPPGSGPQVVVVAVIASAALAVLAPGAPVAEPAGVENPASGVAAEAGWSLLYAEDFSTPLNEAVAPWIWDGHHEPFDTVMDDAGLWYGNDYGPDWETALNSVRHLSQGVPRRAERLVDRFTSLFGPRLGQETESSKPRRRSAPSSRPACT